MLRRFEAHYCTLLQIMVIIFKHQILNSCTWWWHSSDLPSDTIQPWGQTPVLLILSLWLSKWVICQQVFAELSSTHLLFSSSLTFDPKGMFSELLYVAESCKHVLVAPNYSLNHSKCLTSRVSCYITMYMHKYTCVISRWLHTSLSLF